MIPILVLAGGVLGLLPRWWPIAAVLLATVAWTFLWADDDLLQSTTDAIFIFVWGLINIGAGAFIAWLAKRFIINARADRR